MKQYYERTEQVDWETHDWHSLIGSRVYLYLLDMSPNLNGLLGLGEENFTEEEWSAVHPTLKALLDLQRLNEAFPHDNLRLEDYHLQDQEMVERWLYRAMEQRVIAPSERSSFLKRLHQHLGF